MKPLVDYLDYRSYLRDWIDERREQGMPGSNRWFAMKMGSNSTSWLSAVLKGKKGLSKESANRLSLVLKHTPWEQRYLETLVYFNQASTTAARNEYYRELEAIRKNKNASVVRTDQYEFYSQWYYSALRALIGIGEYGPGDTELIASALKPSISRSQAAAALDLLVRLGYVVLDNDSIYRLAQTAITAGSYAKTFVIDQFRQETMRLAQEAIDRFPVDQREIASLTVGVSQATYEQAKALLEQTRMRIAEMANADSDADRVYQVNLQLFPLSGPVTQKVGHGSQRSRSNKESL